MSEQAGKDRDHEWSKPEALAKDRQSAISPKVTSGSSIDGAREGEVGEEEKRACEQADQNGAAGGKGPQSGRASSNAGRGIGGHPENEDGAPLMSRLETRSTSKAQRQQYLRYLKLFKDFYSECGETWPPAELDWTLADVLDDMFLEGNSQATRQKVLAAVEFSFIEQKGHLARPKRALKGWQKLMPARSRLPLPKPVVYGIASLLMQACERSCARNGSPVPKVLRDDPGPGLREARQDRHLRQNDSPRQPKHRAVAGARDPCARNPSRERVANIQFQLGLLQERVRESGLAVGSEGASE